VARSADLANIWHLMFTSWNGRVANVSSGLAVLFSLGLMVIVLLDPSLAAFLFVALWERALWLLPCLFLVILVHELGHLIAGKIVGFQTLLFRVGFLVARRLDGRWRLRFEVSKIVVGGMVIMAPVSLGNLSSNLLLLIAGGPVASLLFGLTCLCALQYAPSSTWAALGYGFDTCAVLSIGMVAVSAWPSKIGYLSSDGLLVLTLLRGGSAAERLKATYARSSSRVTDLRPRAWPAAWIAEPVAEGKTALERFSLSMQAYTHALDSGRITDAGIFLEYPMKFTTKTSGPRQLLLECAYFEGRHRNGAEQARKWFRLAAQSRTEVDSYMIFRCEAAVLLAEGREEEFRQTVKNAKSALDLVPKTGYTLMETDLVSDLERQLELLAHSDWK
jgi:hypothetical protein